MFLFRSFFILFHLKEQQKQDEDEKKDGENKENFATPGETPRRQKIEDRNTPVLSPSRSMDAGINELQTPYKPAPSDWFATPSSRAPITPVKGAGSSKKVFGSLERGLDKMKNMLTPR